MYAGYEWVGWRNDTPGMAGHPLELLFEFDKVRNFSAAHLHTNNLYTKDVQVPSDFFLVEKRIRLVGAIHVLCKRSFKSNLLYMDYTDY